jgi:hypothetical protein
MVQSINDGSNNIKLLQYIVSVSQETFNSSKQKYPQNRCLINIKQSNSSHKSDSQSLGQVPTINITSLQVHGDELTTINKGHKKFGLST